MTYCTEKNQSSSFSGMEAIGRSVVVGYTIGTMMAASASLPKMEISIAQASLHVFSCTTQSRSELSEFMTKHAEASFESIWNNPAEDIWDTL